MSCRSSALRFPRVFSSSIRDDLDQLRRGLQIGRPRLVGHRIGQIAESERPRCSRATG